MCRQPTMRAPLSGYFLPYSPRRAVTPGISASTMAISFRAQTTREISAILQSVKAGITGFLKAGESEQRGGETRRRASHIAAPSRWGKTGRGGGEVRAVHDARVLLSSFSYLEKSHGYSAARKRKKPHKGNI